jgi:signal transduction histidine kinase
MTAAPGVLALGHASRFAGSFRPLTISVLIVEALVVLVGRRKYPWVLFGVGLTGFAIAVAQDSVVPAFVVPIALSLYVLASRGERRVSIPLTAATALALPLITLVLAPDSTRDSRLLLLPAVMAAAAAMGDAQRSRRAYLEELTDRAVRAERERETEAQRRLVEERLRIARDLHDVVAHQITVINLYSGVASATLRKDPDEAERALSTVRQAGRTVLGEIGDLMTMLRSNGVKDSNGVQGGNGVKASTAAEDPPISPQNLGDIATVLDEFGAEGPRRLDADIGEVPEAVGVVAYRVIQEGLVNAQKHGDGTPARVSVARVPGDRLSIRIENAIGEPGAGNGYGLVGVRERVESIRGAVSSGPTDLGTFLLSALLPLSPATGAGAA